MSAAERMTPSDFGVLREQLRSLAENARSEKPTWWLWDDPPSPPFEYGPMLGFARAATPEAVIDLCGEIDRLRKALEQIEGRRVASAFGNVMDAVEARAIARAALAEVQA